MNFTRTKTGGHMVDVLFTLALFCVFAAASLMVVLIGANVYKGTVERMDANFETVTSLTYLTTKIRQHDTAGGVYLDSFQGLDALVLEKEIEGVPFQTWIYVHDGSLRELFTAKGNIDSLSPESGQMLMPMDSLDAERSGDGLLLLTVHSQSGQTATQYIATRSAGERGPNP